jgi:DNA segregation ATPase FtsK/SpoIIIE-like protein
MKNIVFLDYDGVVNRKMWELVGGKWVCLFGYPEDGKVNDTQAVQWVSEFCEKYEYDIVVTSTWRKYPEWEQCLRAAGLREGVRIVGATALPVQDRAKEISDYLAQHEDIESYLVFDNDESLLKNNEADPWEEGLLFEVPGVHRDHLVLCDERYGFGEKEYQVAEATHLSLKYKREMLEKKRELPSDGLDQLIESALQLLYSEGMLSTSLLQRTLSIGYARASKLLDLLKEKKIVLVSRENGLVKYKPRVEYEEARRIMKQ